MVSDARDFDVKASLKPSLYSIAKPAPRAHYGALLHSVNYYGWPVPTKKLSLKCYAWTFIASGRELP